MSPRQVDGLIRVQSSGFRLVSVPAFQDRIEAEGLADPDGFDLALNRATPVSGGRGPNRMLGAAGSTDRLRLRPCLRGGVLGRWLGSRSLGPRRACDEFSLWMALRERRIALPTPVFAASRRKGLFWHSVFASIEIETAHDGARWLADQSASPAAERRIADACQSVACALRRLHDAGAVHGDLHLGNILIAAPPDDDDNEQPTSMLIDLGQTKIRRSVSPRRRVGDMLRLSRSLEKSGFASRATRRVRARFLSTYCGSDRRLRRSMLFWFQFEWIAVARHRLAWRIARSAR